MVPKSLPAAECLLPEGRRISRDTLLLSLHLSRLAYDMDIAPYLDDGWQDVSIQVDEMLLTNLTSRKMILQAASRAKSRMEKRDPISQYRGFRRQKEDIGVCKAVVMAKVLGEQMLIIIAFTGTTRRLYEWLSNLRIEENEGFHAGFLQLTKIFEDHAARIVFPTLGKTLEDILREMRTGSGRYRLFVTGHSQGAALTQIFVYRLVQSGMPVQYVRGVGFASPYVAFEQSVALAADYPVVNVINADDVVARVGGRMHVGMCRVLPSSAQYQRACYGPRADTPVMRDMLSMLHGVRSTEDALHLGIALTESLLLMPENDSEEIIGAVMRMYLPDVLAQRLKGYAKRMAQSAQQRLRVQCEKAGGCVDRKRLEAFAAEWAACLKRYGAKESTLALFDVLLRPHALADRTQRRAYQTLVEDFSQRLVYCMWCQNFDPVWDRYINENRNSRAMCAAYDRFHPLSTQRRRNRDNL